MLDVSLIGRGGNMIQILPRINELAKKQKEGMLTAAESAEQIILRKQYLEQFRAQAHGIITNVKVIDPNGDDVTPQQVIDAKKARLDNNND